MKKFKVIGYKKYKFISSVVESSSQKDALIKILEKEGIKSNSIIRLTSRVDDSYLDNGIDSSLFIDFVVKDLDSSSNWHICTQ